MMIDNPKESDWKLFRKKVPEVRERYLMAKNDELVRMLMDREKTPTECFWDTFDKMKKEKKILEDCLDRHSRSYMFTAMILMRRHGMLKREDLKDFSSELQSEIEEVLRRFP